MYENEDYIDVRVISRAVRTARKPQTCFCGKTINPGEKYHREFGKVDNDVYTVISGTHLHAYDDTEN